MSGSRRMSGSVRIRPSGRYQARVRDPLTNHLVSLGTYATKADADRALTLAIADQTRGAWVDPARGRQTLAAYSAAWLAEHPKLRPRTRELYEGLLRLHILPTLGGLEMGKITPRMIRSWYSGMIALGRPGRSTVAKAYRLLHAIMATATADELVTKNPCLLEGAGLERPGERQVIAVAQVYELARAVHPRYRALVLAAAFTGLRRGELFGLTRSRIDLLHGTVTVVDQRQQLANGTILVSEPKTEAGKRTIALPEPLVSELASHLDSFTAPSPDAVVFCGPKGGPLRPHVWQKNWDAARRTVGLENLHFHDLRHVANTMAASTGASLRELMYRMGHASPDAALRYQHATQERDAAIAQALGALIEAAPPSAERAAVTELPAGQ
jgi:integrase